MSTPGRPYEFPDPDDRSANDPSIAVQPKQVLGLYNQTHNEGRQKVNDTVKSWFISEAKDLGWPDATFAGNSCILNNPVESRR